MLAYGPERRAATAGAATAFRRNEPVPRAGRDAVPRSRAARLRLLAARSARHAARARGALETVDWQRLERGAITRRRLADRAQTGASRRRVALRGGALLDWHVGARRWRLRPGQRPLAAQRSRRSALASGGDPAATRGYRLSHGVDRALAAADADRGRRRPHAPAVGDDRAADRHIDGAGPVAPPRAERAIPVLATLLADDIAAMGNAMRRITYHHRATTSCCWRRSTAPPTPRSAGCFVVGGTQTRVGPHRLYERLAARLAEAGHAVIRFDRRGVGDSAGRGSAAIAASGPDIAAAARRASRALSTSRSRIAASACATARPRWRCMAARRSSIGAGARQSVGGRAERRPAARRRDPRPLSRGGCSIPRRGARLLRGGVDLGKLARGVARSRARDDDQLADALRARHCRRRRRDRARRGRRHRTGVRGRVARSAADTRPAARSLRIATASHSFADPAAFEALAALLAYSAARASASKSASARKRSASSAAMQPVPAAVIAWR